MMCKIQESHAHLLYVVVLDWVVTLLSTRCPNFSRSEAAPHSKIRNAVELRIRRRSLTHYFNFRTIMTAVEGDQSHVIRNPTPKTVE
jgi:hypothetical protein